MKNYLHLFLILISSIGFAQKGVNPKSNFDFQDTMLTHFESYGLGDLLYSIRLDTVTPALMYKTKWYDVSISENPIYLDTQTVLLENPYFSEKLDDHDWKYINNYPILNSVIYDDKIISLFKNGKFVCHNISNFERNIELENQLNIKKFKQHWILNDKLGARSGNRTYIWTGSKWTKLKAKFPLKSRPKLFEDEQYIVFKDCHGEWGGTVYFYDKETDKTYFTEATCANQVIKENGKYVVLVNLGHLTGTTKKKIIENPRRLTEVKPRDRFKLKNGEALGYLDQSKAYKTSMDFHVLQLASTFQLEKKQLYLANTLEWTFLAEVDGKNIKVVHPFFYDDGYVHDDPITTTYGEYIMINLAEQERLIERERGFIIIHNNKIIRFDWVERY